MPLKAIETLYKGHRFRSRLEARWAVFFSSLGLPYEYEKEGFDLNGVFYLPDFWMPSLDIFVEIKGAALSRLDECKVEALVEASGKRCLVLTGQIELPDTEYSVPYECRMYFCSLAGGDPELHCGGSDFPYPWCECILCGKIGAEFDGRSERICAHFNPNQKVYNASSPRLMAAYHAAMGARFEYGESGNERN